MSLSILVAGASGFIGSHVASALAERGHQVRAMTRHPSDYDGAGEPVEADVTDTASLQRALSGVEVAYYLVHSLGSDDFEERDAEAARTFGRVAAECGVDRIIYLGGLGRDDDQLSAHLRSRREVESLLGSAGVPVTVLRAAVVVGHGSISWEITRQLVANLPAMVTPRWALTRTQPIALADVVRYLTGVLEVDETVGRIFEIGGSEVLAYVDMLRRAALIRSGRRLPILPVPLLTPGLSSYWLALVTNVDVDTGRTLIDSMTTEAIVTDDTIRTLLPGETLDYDAAVRAALADREAAR